MDQYPQCCDVLPMTFTLTNVGPGDGPQPPVPSGVASVGPERAKECAEGGSRRYLDKYARARTLPDMFEVVKDLVECELGLHRAGLMLGMVDMGIAPQGFVGAFFVVGGNAIVVNRQAMGMVESRSPELLKGYKFYILLHEYLHSVGVIDEQRCRAVAADLAGRAFGKGHDVTRIASDFGGMFRYIVTPEYGYVPPEDPRMELIPGFDRSSVTYIQ
jgi:hypothetical protein